VTEYPDVAASPSVVVLDDGELDRVRVILERLGVEFALCRRPAAAEALPMARDLLITTGRRALAMPELATRTEPGVAPLWICIHGQDFEALRAQLRALGVHYLVHSAVDQESLRLLIEMLLHGRNERRTGVRLPVGCEVTVRVGKQVHFAKLLELSRGGARLRSDVALEAGDWLSIELPVELGGVALDGLSGHVARSEPCASAPGREAWSVAVELDPLSPEAAEELDAILAGANPSTRISALTAPIEAPPRDRRRSPRRAYRRRVAALTASDSEAPRVALGHDLSAEGIRIAQQPGLKKGMSIALGLYGAEGGNPLVLEAEVVADHGPRGLGLQFRRVAEPQRRALETLLATLPPLESLGNDAETARRLVVSQVIAQKS
jgi:hypothetical protein